MEERQTEVQGKGAQVKAPAKAKEVSPVLSIVLLTAISLAVIASLIITRVIFEKMLAQRHIPDSLKLTKEIISQLPQGLPLQSESTPPSESSDAKVFFERGEDNYYKGNFDAAIADFQKAVELDPKYADAYCEMGVSYMEKSEWDTAIAQLSKAIEVDPAHPKAQYAIAVSYARKPQPDVKRAREHFETSKRLGFVYPEWFEGFLSRLEAGERFPGQEK